MTWISRYRIRMYLRSSLWVTPLAAAIAGVLLHRLIWAFDQYTRWKWLEFSPEGAQAVVGSIASAGLTFIIFLLSMIFIAVQIAASQMTPRLTARVIEGAACKRSLDFFIFTYVFSVAVEGRLVAPVPQLAVLLTVIFSIASIGLFLFLVGTTARGVRPISVFAVLADETARAVDCLYPAQFSGVRYGIDSGIAGIQPMALIRHRGKSAVFTAFDGESLTETARRHDCVIHIIPQVGDFVAAGDPLVEVYRGTIPLQEIDQCLALGPSHTLDQNPVFGFRIIVDIAIRALSPAVNDPTTAVRALDQIQALLSSIAGRDLDVGRLPDGEGKTRVVFRAPGWDDYLWLGLSEIRSYGAGSLQVVRRLRGVLESLAGNVPQQRVPALLEHLKQLDRVVERNFTDPEDLRQAAIGDHQGLGGAGRSFRRGESMVQSADEPK